MLTYTTTALRNLRTAPRTPVLIRAYRPTTTLLKPTSHPQGSEASPVPDHSATAKQHPNTTGTTKGNTTSPTASASQYNSPKSESQDLKEAEEAAAGPEAADAQYGGGNIVEGNYTKDSTKAKERREAGEQGEH
ncbi:hypothetical protein JCM10296v2_006543 [Rhodotorula toruloides]